MEEYHKLLRAALKGEKSLEDRSGVGTVGVFQQQSRFKLDEGFPIITTKPVYWKGVAEEALWFLRGETNIRTLLEKKISIWTSDCLRFNLEKVIQEGILTSKEIEQAQSEAKNHNYSPASELLKRFEAKILEDENFAQYAGELGPVYGAQWRGTNGALAADQIVRLEDALSSGGKSRRMLVSAWNSSQVQDMALPPCHLLWQVHIGQESQDLTLGWTQRSCDTVLGVPFNIASYALIANLLAETHGYSLGELVGNFADLHIYLPHIPAAEEQLQRKPLPLPILNIKNRKSSIVDYQIEDIELINYQHHPKLENFTPMFGGFF